MVLVRASEGGFYIYPISPNRKQQSYKLPEELYQRYLDLEEELEKVFLKVKGIINETDARAVD